MAEGSLKDDQGYSQLYIYIYLYIYTYKVDIETHTHIRTILYRYVPIHGYVCIVDTVVSAGPTLQRAGPAADVHRRLTGGRRQRGAEGGGQRLQKVGRWSTSPFQAH